MAELMMEPAVVLKKVVGEGVTLPTTLVLSDPSVLTLTAHTVPLASVKYCTLGVATYGKFLSKEGAWI
jgi:hypothetical protein